MKKLVLTISILFLSLGGMSLLNPKAVSAAEGGPAGKHMLKAVSGPKAGQVTLYWNDAQEADNYHLVYGTDSKNLKFGVLNIGKTKSYTVKLLNPGTKYYFALVPVLHDAALYTSEWVSAWAMGGVVKSVTPVTPVTMMKSVTPVQATAPKVMAPSVGTNNHWLVAKAGPKVGEVTLSWRHVDVANNYHLVYGTKPGEYKYGALNIGWTNWYTVKALVPGQTYYFALVPVNNNTALYTTSAVKGWAKTNVVQVVQTTKEAVMQPVVPSTQAPGVPGQ